MSPASARLRSSGEAGYTLLEVTIVLVILSGMSLLLDQALRTTQDTHGLLDAAARAAGRGQDLTYAVTGLVSESRHLYEDDDLGNDYLAACDLSRAPIAPQTRLPVIDVEPELRMDTSEEQRVGNMLLFVREINASSCVIDKKKMQQRWIDTYRMVAVYPSLVNRQLVMGRPLSRDLVLWRSLPFVSLPQLLEIGDEDDRERVIRDLVARYGMTHAWDPSLPVGQAFYALSDTGELAKTPEGEFLIEEDETLSEGGRLVYRDVQLARTGSELARQGSVLTAEDGSGWAPNGFEVKIVGPSGSRKVWLHAVFEATAPNGRHTAVERYTTTAHVRDF